MKTISKTRYVSYVWLILAIGIVLSFTFGELYSLTNNILFLYSMGTADWFIGVGMGLAYGRSVNVK